MPLTALSILCLSSLLGTPQTTPWYDAASGFPQYPSISPNGQHVVFSDRGDLWAVPARGGPAQRLTTHPALELRSAFSPDGRLLAFGSTRNGSTNLYTMAVASRDGRLVADGPIRRVTHWDRSMTLSGFSPDGTALLFHAYGDPTIYRAPLMYEAPLDGGPVTRPTTAHGRAPRKSADGKHLVFSRGSAPTERPAYRGSGNLDVWSLDMASGMFTQLSDARSNEAQAFPRPDGSIVLMSSSDGQNNLWRIPSGKTFADAVQLTKLGPGEEATIGHGIRDLGVSGDGSTAVFAVWDDLYTLNLRGFQTQPRQLEYSLGGDLATLDHRVERLDAKVSEVAQHPSGKATAMVARGEVLVRSTEDDHPTRRITEDHARQRHIAWAADGTRLFFTSDEGGHDGIWAATVSMTREDLSPKDEEDDAATDEDDDADDEDADEEDIDDEDTDDATEEDQEETPAQLDEDGAQDDSEQDTPKTGPGAKPKAKPNKTGPRWADALRFDVEQVIPGPDVSRPMPSPDGRRLIYQRDRGDLVLHDLTDGSEQTLLESWDKPQVRWTSDSRHIVYAVSDLDFNTDIWLMDVENPDTAVNLTQHPDLDTSPRISADGKMLVFLSDRNRIGANYEYDTWSMTLDPALLDMTDYELAAYYKDAAKAAGKLKIIPVVDSDQDNQENDSTSADADEGADDEPTDSKKLDKPEKDAPLEFTDLDTAWKRVRRLTAWEDSEGDLHLSPGGERIIVSGEGPDGSGLYAMDHDGSTPKRIVTGSVSNLQGSLNGKTITYVSSGTARHGPSAGGTMKRWPVDADAHIDVAREQDQKFREAARTFGRDFYHPTMKQLDWDGLSERYAALAAQTRTSQAFNRVVDQLFGEVNGSHTGIYGGFSPSRGTTRVGYLGIESRPIQGGYEVLRVLDDSPVDRAQGGLASGDIITGINSSALAATDALPHVDLRHAMVNTSGTETLIDVRGADGEDRMVLLKPISYGGWSALARADELARRRDAVEKASDGRLGYLHIRGMNMPSVHEFERDLHAAAHGKDALVIDVRDNTGGYTTDILLASLTAPAHAYTIPRGARIEDVQPDSYPRDRRLLYAYSRPIVVLCNEHTFSNGEIFSHAIQTTGRGLVVGEETFGGVISTGAFRLIDGTTVRRPFRGWYLPDGTDMESRGAIPDIHVQRTPADEVAGRDAQLEAAVEALMKSLPSTPRAVHPRPAT